MRAIKLMALSGAATLGVMAVPASAATIIETLPDFDSPSNSSGFPIDLGTIGTFTYVIDPNATITSATISGTFGTQIVNTSTAAFDVVVDGEQLTACVFQDPCWQGSLGPFAPFSLDLSSSTFASLLDGSADLGVIQTSGSVVRFGSPTLTINFESPSGVPEPGTWMLMLLGFFGIGAMMRRRESRVSSIKVSYS